MKWITAAGVVMLCCLGISGSAFGAGLVRVTPDGYPGSDPSFLTSPPDDSRVFIAERGDSGSHQAQVRIIKDGVPVNQPFLTIGNVDLVSERGLLSIAFAPDYATSGLFYAFYVAHAADGFGGSTGDIRIVEYHVSSGDPDKADPASARLVFSVPHSAGNHNGGWMAFGPDGDLYFADTNNSRVRAVDLDTGIIRNVVGNGELGVDLEARPATEMTLRRPFGIAFDDEGTLYVMDSLN
ncbi:MAG: PQQ-dependent sugar dehydrogenase, partial [Solirubrobacterales bacterium]|nr:PQQ-dependent sugar dehydrogenase [Solirubrobacterales bacterium]